MPASIESLPFDVLHGIAILLDIRSYINLGRTDKNLYRLLRDENTARRCLEYDSPHSRTAVETQQTGSAACARKCLSLLFDQQEACRTCSPYSASTVAFARQFLFNKGMLCYICDDQIRILDTYRRSRAERVISGHALMSKMTNGLGSPHITDPLLQNTTLLSYADDVLVLLYNETIGPGAWLLAWNVRETDNVEHRIGHCSKLRLRRRLLSKNKLFVRHNRNYLYYGTHSAQRDDGHHEWQIQGCNLNTGLPVSAKPFRLNEFVGSEIGSTACFEIHDGHFYALSNQTSFDTEEVDWTSCYHFVRFKLDEVSPDLKLRKIWRRQHHEGPINDAWTDFSLQRDEQADELRIIEVRKEWLGAGSLCARTSYTTTFTETNEEDVALERPNFPSNDQLSRTLDEHSKPSWLEKPPIRIQKYCHHEYTSNSELHQEFIRAKTKHHSYNSSAHSFIDLVADEIRAPHCLRSKDRLRLRVASRIPASPLVSDGSSFNPNHLRVRQQLNDHNDCPIPNSEETFTDTAIALWPAPDAPIELFDLLCPGGRVGNVHAASDERTIIYMAGTGNPQYNGQRAIVMISFDPGWGHSGLRRLHGGGPMLQQGENTILDIGLGGVYIAVPRNRTKTDTLREAVMAQPVVLERSPKRVFNADVRAESSKRQRVEESASGSGPSERKRLLWTEPAMYLSINQGFWLR